MNDYSEVTASLAKEIHDLSSELAKRNYIEANIMALNILLNMAQVVRFCKKQLNVKE